MRISVVICTYNREQYIVKTLNHLMNQILHSKDYEVIVINNGSTDATEEKVLSFMASNHNKGNFRYVVESQQGLSFARNRGIKESATSIVTFIDDDAFAQPSFLTDLLKVFKEDTDCMAVGGKIIPFYETKSPVWMSKYLLPLLAALDLGDRKRTFPKNKFPIGANMSFRKDVFEKCGLFDVELGRRGGNMMGSEEKDLFYRMKKIGMKILYVPTAVVYHVIPDQRLNPSFIKVQAEGVGRSEALRTRKIGKTTWYRKIVEEITKTVGTLILMLIFCLKGQPQKGLFLLKFRVWVWKGLFSAVC